jgi:hypothetical protein
MATKAETYALNLRDAAMLVARTKGKQISPGLWSYVDKRLRIEFDSGDPHALTVWKQSQLELNVLSVIWSTVGGDVGDPVIVLMRGGSWEDSLERLARSCV